MDNNTNISDNETVSDEETDYGSDSDSDYSDVDVFDTSYRANNSTHQWLIPENVEDELTGSRSFCDQLNARFRNVEVPNFHVGTLSDAFNQAFHQESVRDNKILALYLNHDENFSGNIFFTETFCNENMREVLKENFVLWGWDLTFTQNEILLKTTLSQYVDEEKIEHIANIPHYKLPSVIIVMKLRSVVNIMNIVHADNTAEELLAHLNQARSIFREWQTVEIIKEDVRHQRNFLRQIQSEEYEESLRIDMEKDRIRKIQEEEKQKKEKEIEEEAERLRLLKAEEDAKKEAFRLIIQATLPLEPAEDQKNIFRFRFRASNRNNFERRFESNTTLGTLLNYLIVEGYPSMDYKVMTSWPRTDISCKDPTKTLEDFAKKSFTLKNAK